MASFKIFAKIIASAIYLARKRAIKNSQPSFVVFTGTSGKTTARYLVAYTLKKLGYSVISPKIGYTNELGIILATLDIEKASLKKFTTWVSIFKKKIPKNAFICIELGADFRNDIPWFLKRFKPSIVVVTGVDYQHWSNSRRSIVEHRKRLIESAPHNGAVIFGSKNEDVEMHAVPNLKAKVFRANSSNQYTDELTPSYVLNPGNATFNYIGRKYSFRFSRYLFQPQIEALASTIAVVDFLDKLPDLKNDFFNNYISPEERLEIHALNSDSLIIADTYKAVPKCTEWLLKTVGRIKCNKKILVLSEMRPPVNDVDFFYGRLSDHLTFFSKIYFVGSSSVYKVLQKKNDYVERVSPGSYEGLSKKIRRELEKNSVVLIKGAEYYNLNSLKRNLLSLAVPMDKC